MLYETKQTNTYKKVAAAMDAMPVVAGGSASGNVLPIRRTDKLHVASRWTTKAAVAILALLALAAVGMFVRSAVWVAEADPQSQEPTPPQELMSASMLIASASEAGRTCASSPLRP